MSAIQKNFHLLVLSALAFAVVAVWQSVFAFGADKNLTVAFLDVGQGDAIFIETQNGNQMIIDGGPDRKVLQEIARLMPFGDRSIDVLVVTNPDKDHFAGFIEILGRYDVGVVIEPGTRPETEIYKEFQAVVAERGVERRIARRGMDVVLDDGVIFNVLFPDRDVSNWNTNDGSIVARLSYGATAVLFPGDATKLSEGIVGKLDGGFLKSDILKVGHHGSHTSTGAAFLSLVRPAYAVISAGAHNRYGHPHNEVISALNKSGAEIFVTAETGTLRFESDGKTFELVH